MTQFDWDEIEGWLLKEANRLEMMPGVIQALQSAAADPEATLWWQCALEQSEREIEEIDAAACAFAAGMPLPELPPLVQGRLAVRLRMVSRIARSFGSRSAGQSKGWFPMTLESLPRQLLLRWLLVEGWTIAAEVFDEAHHWSVEHGIAPGVRASTRFPPATNNEDCGSAPDQGFGA